MNDAIWIRPRVRVGRIAWRTRAVRSASRPYSLSPEGGSRWTTSEKRRISMIPSQKLGNDTPTSATAEPSVSQIVPRRTAASTPSGTATTKARASAPKVSCTVGPRRSRISAETGSPVLNERPRSPRRAAPAQPRYCSASGRSSPSRWRICAAASGENSPPISTARGQPHDREQHDRDADEHQDGEADALEDVGSEPGLHRSARAGRGEAPDEVAEEQVVENRDRQADDEPRRHQGAPGVDVVFAAKGPGLDRSMETSASVSLEAGVYQRVLLPSQMRPGIRLMAGRIYVSLVPNRCQDERWMSPLTDEQQLRIENPIYARLVST